MPPLSVTLRSHRLELVRLAELLERFGAEHHLADDTLTNVNLVLDEIVSNVIKHGRVVPSGAIDVSLAVEGRLLTIEVADDGIAFNPLDADPPDLDRPIMERPVGGLGLHIVKTIVETITYRRANDRNHLAITMRA